MDSISGVTWRDEPVDNDALLAELDAIVQSPGRNRREHPVVLGIESGELSREQIAGWVYQITVLGQPLQYHHRSALCAGARRRSASAPAREPDGRGARQRVGGRGPRHALRTNARRARLGRRPPRPRGGQAGDLGVRPLAGNRHEPATVRRGHRSGFVCRRAHQSFLLRARRDGIARKLWHQRAGPAVDRRARVARSSRSTAAWAPIPSPAMPLPRRTRTRSASPSPTPAISIIASG